MRKVKREDRGEGAGVAYIRHAELRNESRLVLWDVVNKGDAAMPRVVMREDANEIARTGRGEGLEDRRGLHKGEVVVWIWIEFLKLSGVLMYTRW